MKLCDKVRPFLLRQSTNMRSPISVEKQVAVTLYYLSDEGRYLKVARGGTSMLLGSGNQLYLKLFAEFANAFQSSLGLSTSNYQPQNRM